MPFQFTSTDKTNENSPVMKALHDFCEAHNISGAVLIAFKDDDGTESDTYSTINAVHLSQLPDLLTSLRSRYSIQAIHVLTGLVLKDEEEQETERKTKTDGQPSAGDAVP